MRFLPYLDDIVPHEPGARAEPVMQRFELGAIVRDGARISRRGWARASVGARADIDFILDRPSAVSAGG